MRKCNNCGKEYDETIKGAIKKYCSKSCGRQDYYQKNKEREKINCSLWYKNHKESEISKNKEYRKEKKELFNWYHNKDRFDGMREIILARDNNQCQSCGSKKVVIHHKDGSGIKKNKISGIKINNDLNNLICLCHPCHMKLHHWQKKK